MSLRPARTHPRAVLLAALLFIALGSGLYAVAPWILPVRIVEGPLLQQAAPDGVTLIWYTTRSLPAGRCQVRLTVGAAERTLAAEASGRRHRVRIDGLAPGHAYPYRICLSSRTLAAATLHTSKLAGERFSFIVFGDSGRGTQAQYKLAARMCDPNFPADFVLHTGDVVYGEGERYHYKDRFFAPYRRLLAEVDFWPTLGNHDLISLDPAKPQSDLAYLEVFELPDNGPPGLPPERNYWFDYASARIAVVDSNTAEPVLAQHVAPWLKEIFSNCGAVWKFVALHHPAYTAGTHRPDVEVQRALVPAFEAADVDIVFCGHDHLYERTHPLRGGEVVKEGEGVVYIVTGAGGAELYDALSPARRPPYIAALNDERHSFTYVQADGDQLRSRQIDSDGRTLDDWTMTKKRPAPATQPRPPASETAPAVNRVP